MVKWGILDVYDYMYRFIGNVVNVKMINLAALVPKAI